MKRHTILLIITALVLGLSLSACSNNNDSENNNASGNYGDANNNLGDNSENNSNVEDNIGTENNTGTENDSGDVGQTEEDEGNANNVASTPKDMVDQILAQVEQPALIEMDSAMVEDFYHLDPTLLEDFSIRMPMMNIKTNEIAILQVKDVNDIPAIEEGVKKRAEDVQKQFEQYLPDQYENAKNYKLITKDNYVFFVISEQADKLVNIFESFFTQS